MRRFLTTVLGIALVALGLGQGAGTAHAATLVVCQQEFCQYRSIQAAVDAADPGDTILISPGVYEESDVEIDKNLALTGGGSNNTTINHTGSRNGGILVHEGASVNINALGFTGDGPGFQNGGVLVAVNVVVTGLPGTIPGTGGGIRNFGNLTLVNSIVQNNIAGSRGGGIYNAEGSRLTLQGSTVRDNHISSPGGSGGGIYNAAERDHVRLDRGTSVTNNQPDNCVNVDGC